jgi:DNA-binding beta-propeller fold protein YncE
MVCKKKYILILTIILLCLPLLLSAQWLETTIYIPDSLCRIYGPHAVTYNSINNTIYVGGDGGNCVIAIDGTTNEKIALIPAGSNTRALVYNPINNKVYCTNSENDC